MSQIMVALVAIIVAAGIAVTAFSVGAPSALALNGCTGEKDSKSCPNIKTCRIRLDPEGKIATECTERTRS